VDSITRLIRFLFHAFCVLFGIFLFIGVIGLISPEAGAGMLAIIIVAAIIGVYRR